MKSQKGASLIIVLVLLSVMLLGIASLAKMGDASSLVAGNVAQNEAALNASEVGVSEAYAALDALTTPDTSVANWYFATKQADDSAGLPTGIMWSNMRSKTVGTFTVRYLVERLCSVTPVTDYNNQCSLKKAYAANSTKTGTEELESTAGVQYRITVNVTGPKDLNTFVQALAIH